VPQLAFDAPRWSRSGGSKPQQRMAEKAVAKKAWSDALVEAFIKAGGGLPGK
jgi:hypothetical protein